MEAGTWIDVLLVLAFILVGGVFAATEIALVSLRSGQVERLDSQGGRGHAVATLARDPNRFLSAVQIGVTVAGFFSAAFGASTLAPSFAPVFEGLGLPAPDTVSLVVTTLVVSYLSLVLGELVPKRLALQRSAGLSLAVAPPLDRFAHAVRPVIWLLSASTNAVVRLVGGDPHATGEELSDEELRDLVSTHEGLGEQERKIVQDVFNASQTTLKEVMRPRGDVEFLEARLPLTEAAPRVQGLPYSRYPVVGDGFDDVIGFLHVRDLLLPNHPAGRAATVGDLVRDVKRLPGTAGVLTALSEMRRENHHLAIVVDEYGGTDGIVTLEDLIEEVIGEIYDEYDEDVAGEEEERPDGPHEVDGLLNLDDFREVTGLQLPEGPYETVAGYVLAELGRLPVVGDSVEVEGRTLTVLELDGRRIARISVSRASEPEIDPAQVPTSTIGT